MARLLRSVALLVFSALLSAQTAVVTRNVNLRSDPSANNPPIAKLVAGTQVQLLDPRLLHHGHVLKCGPRSWRTGPKPSSRNRTSGC
jgi:hypothetical protein